MLITDEIFCAFLNCETKAYLKSAGDIGTQRDHIEWERNHLNSFKQKNLMNFRCKLGANECLESAPSLESLETDEDCLLVDCVIQAKGLRAHIHALERSTAPLNKDQSPFIPIRFFPSEKITKHDKFLLAFDALVLYMASGKKPLFGKIIHGSEQRIIKVELVELLETIKVIVSQLMTQQTGSITPQLILNKHCSECEFQPQCRKIAVEKDELTLLARMTKKERERHHNKGIFSVTQLSYTFRARRRPKRLASRPEKYSHALKALALREQKIYIVGRPELNPKGNLVFLDVEGIPDRDFYYLIGFGIKNGDSYIQHSFWANARSDEKEIWGLCLRTLAKIDNPQLIHYGSYETTFLKTMKERYPETVEDVPFLDRLIADSVNLLSVIYAQIYFPTYSNGLKEIAKYLGFQWSDDTASGLKALIWRLQWESSGDASLKQNLITYNIEDCEALKRAADTVVRLCQKQTEATNSTDTNIVFTDLLKRESPHHLGRNSFFLPELEYINKSAYWDYQRDKVYVKSSQQLKRASKKAARSHVKTLPVNKVVKCPPPTCCSKCNATNICFHDRESKIVYDLKFSRAGIKRWIVKYYFDRYKCRECGVTFYSQHKTWTRRKFGQNFLAYVIYQSIELRLPQETIAQSLNQLFGFNLNISFFGDQKTRAAQFYNSTYEAIMNRIVNGKLIHADETKVSIEGKSAYVWVFSNLEDVAYRYTETREGDFLQELLREFKGVLVSDFYAAYDSIDCPQQKCLIHLIRDLNDDLLKQPFDEELKGLAHEFTMLLKPMIETVDRFGLKTHFLRKHKVFVERFYKTLSKRGYKSEIALKYKKRFEKYQEKLFTFLYYDGIPWNNNNAEHAVKAFAMLRKVIGGKSSDKGIREYLVLLSIGETCKYKGVSFLDFLRSGEKDIDVFIEKQVK